MILMEKEWDRATATYDYIMIPNRPPVRRKHKNVWQDATEADLMQASKYNIQHLFKQFFL